MKTLRMKRVAENLYRIDPPVTLEQTTTTRRTFVSELARDEQGQWRVRGTFFAERKGANGWECFDSVNLAKLKAGELGRLELRSEHVRRLYAGLQVLAEAAEQQGTSIRPSRVVVGKEDEIVRVVEHEHKAVIDQLISQNRSREFWSALTSLQPDIAAQIADAEVQRKRKLALRVFEQELQRSAWTEPQWEKFFIQNKWIFGYGLRYQFLSVLQNQANYGGADYTKKGGQKGEFLMNTEAENRFTVVVEIKKPNSQIFNAGSAYRSGVPGFSAEFVDAISQVHVNARTWDVEGSRRDSDREMLTAARVHTITPRSILVFGNTDQLENHNQRRAFQLFRGSLHTPDIIAFDELLERARFIVSEAEEAV